mmetsp:Transcript_41685/g.83627  ORF Transcript_41685/g.83627 Transcript_41685/m.83627 type:complete len:222 (-) Transcript_41685:736-1401(-)
MSRLLSAVWRLFSLMPFIRRWRSRNSLISSGWQCCGACSAYVIDSESFSSFAAASAGFASRSIAMFSTLPERQPPSFQHPMIPHAAENGSGEPAVMSACTTGGEPKVVAHVTASNLSSEPPSSIENGWRRRALSTTIGLFLTAIACLASGSVRRCATAGRSSVAQANLSKFHPVSFIQSASVSSSRHPKRLFSIATAASPVATSPVAAVAAPVDCGANRRL